MLLFIYKLFLYLLGYTHFNTSHVTVYHGRPALIEIMSFISIHLMLLFIKRGETQYLVTFVFQYISCYCLS